jgi:hypothetical protein
LSRIFLEKFVLVEFNDNIVQKPPSIIVHYNELYFGLENPNYGDKGLSPSDRLDSAQGKQ